MQRWRLVVSRSDDAPELTQREAAVAWEEAITATGLPVATVDAERQRPRLAFGAPPGGSIASRADLVDLWLVRRMPVADVRAAIIPRLPPGHRLEDLHDVWLGEAALPGRVVASDVRAAVRTDATVDELRRAVASILAASTVRRVRMKAERAVEYDLRPFILDAAVDPDDDPADGPGAAVVRMRLGHDPERGIGRAEEVLAELADRSGHSVVAHRLVRLRLLLREDLPPRPTTGGRDRSVDRGVKRGGATRPLPARARD